VSFLLELSKTILSKECELKGIQNELEELSDYQVFHNFPFI